jgi:hypothetical protein
MTLIRTESFVPLISAAPNASSERANFQAKVVPNPDQAQKFQPAESSIPASHAPGAAARSSQCEPRVSLQRDGDRITGIRVQCSCGQVIDLACVYQADAAAAKG